MPERLSRRRFVSAGLATGAVSLLAAPAVIAKGTARPAMVGSWNAATYKNGGPRTGIAEAFERMLQGADVLDALLDGVAILELDPTEDSVGYGGLPNADGVVQLDACCMHGPTRRAGGVAALEGVRTPSKVARAVLDETDHHLLVGRGAQEFARHLGFGIEEDLNTEHSRRLWLEWKRRSDPEHWLDPAGRAPAGAAGAGGRAAARGDAGDRARAAMVAEGLLRSESVWGTVHLNGINAKGEISGVTTTSGLAWKIPGRVGDSPILGAGNYVDGTVGAAGSTGRGEANLYGLSSFLIVELLRQGKHPKDAAIEALRRIVAATTEKRLLNAAGRPRFNVKFYVLDSAGRHAGVALYGGADVVYSVATEAGVETPPMEAFLPGSAET
jgi:N4-(beta-N-acetylglucosaminyl)-L-asparaginase